MERKPGRWTGKIGLYLLVHVPCRTNQLSLPSRVPVPLNPFSSSFLRLGVQLACFFLLACGLLRLGFHIAYIFPRARGWSSFIEDGKCVRSGLLR